MGELWQMTKRGVAVLRRNPQLFMDKLAGKLNARRSGPRVPFGKQIAGVKWGMDVACDERIAKAMYHGYFELDVVDVMRRLLPKGGVFVDVGANVGYLTATALGLVGRRGQVHAFEPVPEYCQKLRRIAAANPEYNLTVNQCALGEAPGTASIDVAQTGNIGWNTIVPRLMDPETPHYAVDVRIRRLDAYIEEEGVRCVDLIKIDTEGYEFPILRGLTRYLDAVDRKPSIICEVSPAAYQHLGYDLTALARFLGDHGYAARLLDGANHTVEVERLAGQRNILLLPRSAV